MAWNVKVREGLLRKINQLRTINTGDIMNLEGIEYFRNKLFNSLLTLILLFAVPLYLYDITIFISESNIFGVIMDAIFITSYIILLKFKLFSINMRKIASVAIIYITGVFLLVTTGSVGSGMSLVFFSIVVSGFLLDKKYSVKLLCINVLIFICLSLLLYNGKLNSMPINEYRATWIINVLVVQLFGGLSFLIMNLMLEGLKKQVDLIKNVNSVISESEKKCTSMIANISDVIIIADERGIINHISPNIYDLYGKKPDELLYRSIFDNIYVNDKELVKKNYNLLLEQSGLKKVMELRYIGENGEIRYIKANAVNLLEDSNINGILLNYHDITYKKEKEAKILYTSYHDNLTDLYNRTFFEKTKQDIDTSENLPISIISIDVDGLKLVNDSLGHIEGDKLLKEIAHLLKISCRKEDIIARVGGDEFCILLPNSDIELTENIVSGMNTYCKTYNKHSKEVFYMSFSIGYSIKFKEVESLEYILNEADNNMYENKVLSKQYLQGHFINSIRQYLIKSMPNLEKRREIVVELAKNIGNNMGLSNLEIEQLELFVNMRDIGKIRENKDPLNNDNEINVKIKPNTDNYCEKGYKIAMSISELSCIADSILTQHEMWDGSGYPKGLSGNDISLNSRIVSVVEVYLEMYNTLMADTNLSQKEINEEIKNRIKLKFDPIVVESLFKTVVALNN
ncbi:MAG: diguanylate cyclase [Sedimentibacter sp.]